MDDSELLSAYLADGSEAAFTALVDRHMKMVYSAALRQVGGDAYLAKDVAQRVFTALARKATALRDRKVLSGWLYTSTRFAAAEAVRGERRRQAREQAAALSKEPAESAAPEVWDRLRPVLDRAMTELNARDREALLLRYFENQPFAVIGAKLALSEDAARRRVDRALDKMHGLLARHGAASTTVALALALTDQAASAAVPAGLSAEVAGAALAGAGPIGALGLVHFMATVKTNAWIFAGLVALSATAVLVEKLSNDELRREAQGLLQQEGRSAAALAASQRQAKGQEAELADLSRIKSLAETSRPEPDETQTPNYKRAVLPLRAELSRDYGALFRHLHLTAEQQTAFERLLLEKRRTENVVAAHFSEGVFPGLAANDLAALKTLVSTATQDLDAEISQDLGANGFAEYQNYTATLAERKQIDDFSSQLLHTSSPLRDDQADRLVELLAQSQSDGGPPDSFAAGAAGILDPAQAPALKTLVGAVQARQTILAMNRAALARGQPPLPPPSAPTLLLNLQP